MRVLATDRFVTHGVPIAVTSDDEEMLDSARWFLPPLRTTLTGGRVLRRFHLSRVSGPDGQTLFGLHGAGKSIASSANLHKVLNALEWEVHLFLAQRARDKIFVHAGVVEWNRKAVVVPGRSFSGKSTLVAALVRAGCAYLSDEYAILDSKGVCHAHPRRLSLRVNGRVEQHTAEELGGRTQYEPLQVGSVIVTRYRQGSEWKPSRLSTGQAVMALLQNTVAARSRTGEALAVLRASMTEVEAYRGARGEAAEAVRAILSQP